MIEHIATVRDRAITWDKREVVQHGLNSDTIRVDADDEFASCDTLALILFNVSNPRPMRYMVDETLTVRIPSALMEQTGALSVCLIGYVGGAVRIVTKQERMPLVVVKSGETGGIDADDDNPDLWGQLLAAEAARVEAEHGREAAESLRVAAETARVAAETEREENSAAAVKAANDAAGTASKAAEKAKADTDAAIAKADAAEQARAGAETLRVEAENGRVSAENLRVSHENERQNAEATRVEAETERVTAENKRQQDTSTAIGNANKATSAADDAALAATSAASDAEQKGNAAQEIADNIKAAADRGDYNGSDGAPGKDGTSPTASVNRTDTGAVITVTDANGTTTAEVLDGRDGETVIPDLGVTNVKIADNAVNTRTIADGSVTRAKLAQDALVKAGAGISIADDGTAAVDMDGLRDMMQVSNQRIGVPVDGVSTGSVYYSFTPFMMTVIGRDGFTVQKPANAASNYVRFMRLDTDMVLKKTVTNTDAVLVKESTGVPYYVGYSIDADGTVWLEMYLTDNDKHTFTMNAFSNIIIPLCGGGIVYN